MTPTPAPVRPAGWLSLEDLAIEVKSGRIDTVLVGMTDMQGRLQGKRTDAHHFLRRNRPERRRGLQLPLAVDVDMNTVDGYARRFLGPRLRRLRACVPICQR